MALASPAYSTAAGLEVANPWTDANGVTWYDATSSYNGPGSTTLRILSPTSPAAVSHRFIYVLPVIEGVDLQDVYGDGLEELRALNVHNDYNAHIIAPSFAVEPWYGDHDTNPEHRYESFMVNDLVPWVQANLATTGQEQHWIVGFSKSGFGAVTLLFRNPTAFDAAVAWDFPADQPDANDWGLLENYGTDANFQSNYRLTSEWIAARKAPFQAERRLWLSHDDVTFSADVSAFAGRLQANQVQFMRTGGATRAHSWTSGWLLEAVANLQSMRYTAQDNFNRADGGLGSNWTIDPWWGPGISVSGNQASTPVSGGGAHFWSANTFGADQFSEIKLTGAIGDWVGVAVRGQVSPRQGYWLAVKPDGAYLYALLNGSFYQLAHDPTSWSTGDVLRLSVRTVDTSTARLTVYRNGTPLFTHDEVTHFIGSGYPGIGLYASTAVSLDDWQGGELSGAPEPPPTPGPSSAQDDFNRANGSLGPNWTIDPWWGSGISVAGNQAASPIFSGGAHFWSINTFGADQFSEIKLTGTIADWVGVSVRGRVSPGQGYWLAVKPDGAHLYSFLNGAFHELVHNPVGWSTGDVLRLGVRTVDSSTARLTVYRNGTPLFTHDDTVHFIQSGYPGIGLYASNSISLDDWRGGELDGAPEPPPTPGPSSAQDDFNRADGGLGPNWASDPQWGSGISVASNQAASPISSGGAHFWNINTFGADQFSEIKLTGAIGDWIGVSVRGQVSPGQGYWLAIKADGAYLYSFLNGAFHQLVHDPAGWSTGDVLRLEVRTVAANTARLTVYRSGTPLFTHDDAAHFIESGYPGIGLYASTAVSLDDWAGGTLDP